MTDKNFEQIILEYCKRNDCMINEINTTVYIEFKKKAIAFRGWNRWEKAIQYMADNLK